MEKTKCKICGKQMMKAETDLEMCEECDTEFHLSASMFGLEDEGMLVG